MPVAGCSLLPTASHANAYAPAMRTGARAAIDRRLEGLMIARVRQRWPVVRLVPVGWIRPVIKPTVVRLRVSLVRGAIASALAVGSILTLLILVLLPNSLAWP